LVNTLNFKLRKGPSPTYDSNEEWATSAQKDAHGNTVRTFSPTHTSDEWATTNLEQTKPK